MKRVSGSLKFECEDEGEALAIVAGEIAGRWQVLGWDAGDIEIEVVVVARDP